MALLTIILTVSLLLAFSYTLLYLVSYIHKDGYGRPRGHSDPPHSHAPDIFDPRYRHSRHA